MKRELFIVACIFLNVAFAKPLDFSKHKGSVVYLDFWASWCDPCKASFPWMQKMQEKYEKKGLEVVAINLDKEKKLADKFLKTHPVSFEIIYDPKGENADIFKLKGMPSSIFINKAGKVVGSHVGFKEADKLRLEKKIVSLLK